MLFPRKSSVFIKLIYITIVSGFFGSSFFNIFLGDITLFPYRILIILLSIFFFFNALKKKKIDVTHIKTKNYLYFFLFWLIYALFSLGWASSKIDGIKNIIFLFFSFFIVFVVVYFFRNINNYKILYMIWIIVLIIMIILGFWNLTTGNQLSSSKFQNHVLEYKRHIPTAVFHNPNNYATYLALSIPFLLPIIKYKTGYRRIIIMVILFLSIFILIKTYSRANYISLVLGFVFWFLFNLDIKAKFKYILVGLLISIILFWVFPEKLSKLFSKVYYQFKSIFINYSEYSDKQDLGSIGVRINLIKNSICFLFETFWLGIGPGNFEYYIRTSAVYNTAGIMNLHNWWFEILVEYGLLVFSLYILFFINILKNLFKINKSSQNINELIISEALITSLVVFIISSISPSSILTFKPQWLLFSFAIGFINYYRFNKLVGD